MSAILEHHQQDWGQQPILISQPHLNVQVGDLTLDYRMHFLAPQSITVLAAGAKRQGLSDQITALCSGKAQALHTCYRQPADQQPLNFQEEAALVTAFVESFHQGKLCGSHGEPFTTVVNLGVGGSDLGMRMATQALMAYPQKAIVHFYAELGEHTWAQLIQKCDPRRTLFVIASKSFQTPETLSNATRARAWLQSHGCDFKAHSVAITAAPERAIAYGVPQHRVFSMSCEVGGRFSIWSAMGLSVRLALGNAVYQELLAGAHQMDVHFQNAPFLENMPVMLALISHWYIRFWEKTAQAILPYDARLGEWARYVQQLEMESNGKSVDKLGHSVKGLTSPIIFGEYGVLGQHTFFQWLHQAPNWIPVDLIAVTADTEAYAHCRSQMAALAQNNRPFSVLQMPEITPHTLGMLMALYEHKVFSLATLWNINPFDQPGVELGKKFYKEQADISPAML